MSLALSQLISGIWLKRNLGTYQDNELSITLPINDWIYEVIVISEVSENSISFENPVGGAALEKAQKLKSNKSF